jgi:putative ABC transport system permease protein
MQYLKTSWRNIRKHRSDSLMNVFGLCISLSAAMMLLLSVGYEYSFDKFNRKASNIYHLNIQTQRSNGQEISSILPAPILPALKKDFGEIVSGTRITDQQSAIRYHEKKIAQTLTFADGDFFKMFSFPVLKGNSTHPLSSLTDVVLTRSNAEAVFGGEEPVGKTVEFLFDNVWKPFRVSAVVDDCPANSSIVFSAIVPFEAYPDYDKITSDWNWRFVSVFIELDSYNNSRLLADKLKKFSGIQFQEDIDHLAKEGIRSSGSLPLINIGLSPLADMHTSPEISGYSNSVDRTNLYFLAIIGILIVIIACVNFVNLNIGRLFTRSKEIAIRKTMGASSINVAFQFWMEAFLIFFISFLISCGLCYLLIPQYKVLFGMNIQRGIFYSLPTWLYLLSGIIIVTCFASMVPALMSARLNVTLVLKGKNTINRSGALRNILIGTQFTVAIFLISCTIISSQQLNYLQNRPLGYSATQVISIPVNGEIDPTETLQLMRNKLSAIPSIESISGIYDNLGVGQDGSNRTSIQSFNFEGREIKSNWLGVSYDFVRTLGLQLIAGRDFSRTFSSTDSNSVVINEELANELGGKQAVGKRLFIDSAKQLVVIGVVRNYYFKSLRKKIAPLSLVLDKDFAINYILVKVNSGNLTDKMRIVTEAWQSVAPGVVFQGSFLNENVNRQYIRERKLLRIFSLGTAIAILVSCMGLFSIVILILSQKLREIGVRKILGASVGSIVFLIAGNFLWMVVLAFLIASPLGWYFMNKWLQSFAYHIEISWMIFILAGFLVSAIVFLTISIKSIGTARSNPARILRSE